MQKKRKKSQKSLEVNKKCLPLQSQTKRTGQCGSSSVGRAQPCQGWGREFEPRLPLQKSAEMLTYFLKKSLRLSFTELRLTNIHPTGFNHMSVVLVHKVGFFVYTSLHHHFCLAGVLGPNGKSGSTENLGCFLPA